MQNDLPIYELYAIRYAMRHANRSEHFIGGDPHDSPMPMDYFVWLARCGDHNVLIDTGFTEVVAARRGRQFLHCPIDTLAALGVAADTVQDIILTHLHYDHSGNFDQFANASFHLQEKELQFATGKYMRHPRMSYSFEVEDVCGIVRMNYKQRVMFHDGDDNLCPGITLHGTGGHSAGLQFVSVHTKRGWVVLASDAAHFYENMDSGRPFTVAYHVGEMLESFDRLCKVAPSHDHIIPGHDPLVMRLYPAVDGFEGRVAQLDVPPVKEPDATDIP